MGPRAELRPIAGEMHAGLEYGMVWTERPKTVLILKKPNDIGTERAFLEIMSWMYREHPDITIAIEDAVAAGLRSTLMPNVITLPPSAFQTCDFVITLGGDGTILHASGLFRQSCPPILSFSLGTLGFLLPFHIQSYRFAINSLLDGDSSLLLRMRLSCSVHAENGDVLVPEVQSMNEIVIHRGRRPHLTALDCFVNDEFLTDVVADGLIVSTPTGSTAYNLSAGGPILHPSVDSILFTPICPRSLSFRPAILPPSVTLKVRLSSYSRGLVELSIDGRDWRTLRRGEYCRIRQSPHFVPCVNRLSKGVAWVRDIRDMLKWNISFEGSSSLLRHSDSAWDSARTSAPPDPRGPPEEDDILGAGLENSTFEAEGRDEEEAAYRISNEEDDQMESAHYAESRRALEQAAAEMRKFGINRDSGEGK